MIFISYIGKNLFTMDFILFELFLRIPEIIFDMAVNIFYDRVIPLKLVKKLVLLEGFLRVASNFIDKLFLVFFLLLVADRVWLCLLVMRFIFSFIRRLVTVILLVFRVFFILLFLILLIVLYDNYFMWVGFLYIVLGFLFSFHSFFLFSKFTLSLFFWYFFLLLLFNDKFAQWAKKCSSAGEGFFEHDANVEIGSLDKILNFCRSEAPDFWVADEKGVIKEEMYAEKHLIDKKWPKRVQIPHQEEFSVCYLEASLRVE